MRKLVLLIKLIMAISLQLTAQTKKDNEQLRAEEAVIKFFDGLAILDTNMMKQNCTKDFLLLEDGAVWNMDSLISKLIISKRPGFSRTNHLNFFQTEVKGGTAWLAYNNTADISINGQKMNINWLESAVLTRYGNNWKIQMLHSTPLRSKSK